MISIPLEDLVFIVCLLVGGGLLLITVLVDDVLGGIFDALDISIGGASLMPLLLSFVSMFGVGGLFATQVLDLHQAAAAAVGVLFGLAGAALAIVLFGFMKRSEAPNPFSTADLVGHDAFVAITIPASHWARFCGPCDRRRARSRPGPANYASARGPTRRPPRRP